MNGMDSKRLSTDKVLERFGGAISRAQLERWLKAGLIPSPTRHGLGQRRGTVSLYDPIVVPILKRVLELQQPTRDMHEWRWKLWLDGYPIQIEKLCDDLVGRLIHIQHQIEAARSALDSTPIDRLDEIEKMSAIFKAKDQRLFRHIVRRVRDTGNADSMITFATSHMLGYDPPVPWEESVDASGPSIEELFAKFIGLTVDSSSTIDFVPDFSPSSAIATINGASESEWRVVRRDWQTITQAFETMEIVLSIFERLQGQVQQLSPEDIALLRATRKAHRTWLGDMLAVARLPIMRSMLTGALITFRRSELSGNVDEVMTALRLFVKTIDLARTNKPSRRVQPSEGTTSGRTSSRCTPMISATEKSETES